MVTLGTFKVHRDPVKSLIPAETGTHGETKGQLLKLIVWFQRRRPAKTIKKIPSSTWGQRLTLWG